MKVKWLFGHRDLWRVLAFLLPTLLLLVLMLENRVAQYREEFEAEVGDMKGGLEQAHLNALATIDAVAAAYQVMSEFDPSRLSTLAASMQYRHRHLKLVAYASWIREGQAKAFVTRMVEDGYPTFRINGDGAHTLTPGQPGYLPIRFIEPSSPRLLGLLGKDVIRNSSDIPRVRELVASGRSSVLADWTPQPRFRHFVFYARAAYRGFLPPDDQRERMAQFDGIFLVGLDTNSLLRELKGRNSALRLSLEMPHAGGQQPPGAPINTLFAGQEEALVRLVGEQTVLGGSRILRAVRSLSAAELLSPELVLFPPGLGILALMLVVALQSRAEARAVILAKQRELDDERRRADGAMRSISDAILMLDEGHRVRYVNRVGERMLGWTADEITGRPVGEVLELIDIPSAEVLTDLDGFLERLGRGEAMPDVLLNSHLREQIPVNLRVSRLEGHEHGGLVLALRDNSHERELTRRLEYQANHDHLTGLLNRNAFEARVRDALALAAVEGNRYALLFIDLDRFKLINDTHGHEAGDQLLKLVTEVLENSLRDEDCIGRMGGDEFAILMRTPSIDVAAELAERIRRRLESMRFLWAGNTMDVHASLGVVLIDETTGTFEDLMKNADLACHAAKEAGRNAVHLFQPDDNQLAEHRRQIQWLPRLNEAIENDQFVLYRQAIWPARRQQGEPELYELLLRLRDVDGTDLLPGLFLPAAERFDMMRSIDRHVIRLAMEAMGDPDCMPPGSQCTINLSGQTLTDETLLDYILEHVALHEVEPQRVCFEITETAAISNLNVARRLAGRMRSQGFRLMLDDFGAGMSSLGYLHNLQVDFIKIDGQFVRNAVSDPLSAVSVRMICEIARVLGVDTIAEMIEDQATVLAMREYGVDYLQGFSLSKPEPVPRSRRLRLAHSR